jgi:hypothetical protein
VYALAQPRPFNAELSATGGIALQARVLITASLLCLSKVSLRYSWEQDGLLICAISSDDAVALVVLMISPQYSHRLPFSRDLLIRRLCHTRPLPAHSWAGLPKRYSLVRGRWQR